ncbi:hypothetical protein [Desulfonatronum sp. SC1]|uniref:hypothetical protein n=1 Tax=Desulfonatronum sp. SC1 TaxID=2109626 RepID=UPI0011B28807|nr:hypothetical protein [Desulfonatronum sp. SC1]
MPEPIWVLIVEGLPTNSVIVGQTPTVTHHKHIPNTTVTTHTLPGDLERFLAAEMGDYLREQSHEASNFVRGR